MVVRARHRLSRLAGDADDRRERVARVRPVQAERRGGGYEPWALQVLELEDGRIKELTFFLDTDRVFPLFGLPPRLDASLGQHILETHEGDEVHELRRGVAQVDPAAEAAGRELEPCERVDGDGVRRPRRRRRIAPRPRPDSPGAEPPIRAQSPVRSFRTIGPYHRDAVDGWLPARPSSRRLREPAEFIGPRAMRLGGPGRRKGETTNGRRPR